MSPAIRWVLKTILILALSALFVSGLPRLKMDADPLSHLPLRDPAVAQWREINQEFDALNLIMIGLEEPYDALSTQGLASLQQLTAALSERKADGLLWVRSIANLEDIQEDAEGTLNATMALPAIPQDDAGRLALKRSLQANVNAMGSMISPDLRAYIILVRVDPARPEALTVIRDTVDAGRGPLIAHYFGPAFFTASIGSRLAASLPWVLPIGIVLLLAGLAWGLRRFWKVLGVFGGSALVLVWWVGAMGWSGIAISNQVMGVAFLLLPAALACFASWPERPLSRTLMLCAISLAMVGVGVWTDRPLQDVALASALGLVCLLLVDALVTGVVARSEDASAIARSPSGPRWLPLALALLLAVVGGYGFRFLSMPGDMFLRCEETGQTIAFMDRHFGGSDFVQVRVVGDVKKNVEAARLMRFTDLIEGKSQFSDVRSITQVLAMLAGNFGGSRNIPESQSALDNLRFFVEGSPDLRSLTSSDWTVSMLALRIPPGALDRAGADRLETLVQDTFERSASNDADIVGERIAAVTRRAGMALSPEAIALAVRTADAAHGAAGMPEEVIETLMADLAGPQAEGVLGPQDWEAIALLLGTPGIGHDAILARIEASQAFRDGKASPEMARQLADTLLTRAAALRQEHGVKSAIRLLLGDQEVDPVLEARLRGILADLSTRREGTSRQEIVVSGYPLVGARLGASVIRAVRIGVSVIALMAALLLLLSGRNALSRAWRALLLVLLSTGASFGLLYLTGWHVDPGSLALCFLPALMVAVLFDGGGAESMRRVNGALAGFLLLALALCLTGIGPMVRMGIVAGLGMVTSWLVVRKGGLA